MTEHLDLDALADVLAGEPVPAHLAGCAACTAELDELRAADAQVSAALHGLADPPLPAGLAERLDAALAREARGSAAGVTLLPTARNRRAARWLPAAAAAVLVIGGIAYGVTQLGGEQQTAGSSASAGKAAATPAVVRNATGTDYTGRADLAAAVPRLLAGTTLSVAAPAAPAAGVGGSAQSDNAQRTAGSVPGPARAAAADPLAGLRADPGLADCLAALLPPEDPSVRPLALDYGEFRGKPAMVVVLPGTRAKSLDVFAVGPGCSRANDSVLFYTSVPAS